MEQTIESKDINIGILKEKLRYYQYCVHTHTHTRMQTHTYTQKLIVSFLLLGSLQMRILKRRRV